MERGLGSLKSKLAAVDNGLRELILAECGSEAGFGRTDKNKSPAPNPEQMG